MNVLARKTSEAPAPAVTPLWTMAPEPLGPSGRPAPPRFAAPGPMQSFCARASTRCFTSDRCRECPNRAPVEPDAPIIPTDSAGLVARLRRALGRALAADNLT